MGKLQSEKMSSHRDGQIAERENVLSLRWANCRARKRPLIAMGKLQGEKTSSHRDGQIAERGAVFYKRRRLPCDGKALCVAGKSF